MTLLQILDHTDPRLGLRPNVARLEDGLTRAAIRILTDALASFGDRAISGPSLGLPLRIIAVRLGDLVHCVLNPSLVEARHLYLSQGETSLHLAGMRRDVVRAAEVTLSGTGISGKQISLALTGTPALEVQQAFELLDGQSPFGWMTAFHQVWSRSRGTPAAGLFETVNAGLYAPPVGAGIIRDGLNRRKIMFEGDHICDIDALNPLTPLGPHDPLVLGLMVQFSGMRSAFFSQPRQFGIAVAAQLMAPGMAVHVSQGSWPLEAARALGLAPQTHPFALAGLPEDSAIKLDLAMIDHASRPGTALPADLRSISRVLSGERGALIIVTPAEDAALEEMLQKHFAVVYAFSGPLYRVYVARKSPLTASVLQARLLNTAHRLGLADLPWRVQISEGQILRKDGRKDRM